MKPKGHVYPLGLVRLALTWVCDAHTSYRATSLIFSTLRGWVIARGPCAETIRQWLLRVGLFLLRRPLPPCSDWVLILDLTIQLGQRKCLVILGTSLARFRKDGCRLNHRDVVVLSVQVLTSCTKQVVEKHLNEVCRVNGEPVQIVCDHGSDVIGGVRLFRDAHPQVIETYDITHGLANLLKAELEHCTRWNEFVKGTQLTRQQIQQTAGSFLQPPAWRQKSRYMNLESHLAWARDMLSLLSGKADVELARQLGWEVADSRSWLEKKLLWLLAYKKDIETWSFLQEVVKQTEEEIKKHGLRRCSWKKIKTRMKDRKPKNKREKRFYAAVVRLVREEGKKVEPREAYVGSSDVVESMFGKFKEVTKDGPTREITSNALMIPLFATVLTPALLQEALESIHEDDVLLWIETQLGASSMKKKKAVLAALGHNTEDPDLAGKK